MHRRRSGRRIANALKAAYAGSKVGNSLAIGSGSAKAYYKVSGNAGALKLELAGYATGAAATDVIHTIATNTNQDKFTQAMAAAFNSTFPGAAVSISVGSTGVVDTGNSIIHGLTSIKKADSSVGADRWGADVNLDVALMKEGAQLKIGVGTGASDTRTFTISISSTATRSTVNGDNVIISTKVAGTNAADQLKEFIKVMEGQDAGVFKISGKGSNMLHIDVRASVMTSTPSKVKGWSSATLQKAVSAKQKDTAAHNAGVEFNIKATAFTKGDVIKVGNGTAAKTYVYGTGTDTSVTYFASAAALKAALVADFGTSKVATAANGTGIVKFTVYASSATAAAPMVQGRGLTLQIGDTSDKFNQLNVGVQDMHAVSLGIDGLSIKNEVDAQGAIHKIKNAINTVSDVRGTLGATQNRLDHTINNLSVMQENIQDAESTIRDTDVAEEMMAYTKNNILIQSAQAMLAQANQVPQGVLQLLQ